MAERASLIIDDSRCPGSRHADGDRAVLRLCTAWPTRRRRPTLTRHTGSFSPRWRRSLTIFRSSPFGFAVAVFRRCFGEELTMTLVAQLKDASDIDDLRFPFLLQACGTRNQAPPEADGQQLPTAELGHRGSIRETRAVWHIERRDTLLDASCMEDLCRKPSATVRFDGRRLQHKFGSFWTPVATMRGKEEERYADRQAGGAVGR
jgi:hypothetical protein